ncbi:GNAT family N-acetyltransferase [Streptomyces sp. NPDC047072]|uniref:GNAT family N-acetyltransferase n=1 Tax=Streptomyces sp. NPDC047072 TaxID=3154809 RepID=UPI0033CF988D
MDIDVQSFTVAHLRRRPAATEVAGFIAGFDPATTSPYVNYATPVSGFHPSDQDVRDLITAFRERGLRPRLEFAPGAAPAVEAALRRTGFTVQAAHEYLVCTPTTLTVPSTEGAVVETPRTDEDFAALDTALSEAFAGAFTPSAEGAARLRRTQELGGAVGFVRAPDGGCTGGGACSAPAVGTAELTSVGTRPAFRGRGLAALVTAALTGAVLARGARSVWLECSGEGSRRVYERVGYRAGGTRLYMALDV